MTAPLAVLVFGAAIVKRQRLGDQQLGPLGAPDDVAGLIWNKW